MYIAVLLLVTSLQAQTVADPSGHWEGSVQIPDRELSFEVDLAKNAKGQFIGTIGIPSQDEIGVPLTNLFVDGAKISFGRPDQPFHGVLSSDNKSISGDYTISGFTLPFTLTRKGEAHIEAPPKNAPVSKEFEGVWNGTLKTSNAQLRFILKMTNESDGTSTATVTSLDEGGLQFPVAVTQQGRNLSFSVKSVSSSYSGVLNADGTEFVGTFTQRSFSAPLTFHRREF